MGNYLTPAPATRSRFFIAIILFCLLEVAPESKGQSEIKIFGQVIEKVTGSPIPGAQIWIQPLGRYTISGQSGEFYFTDLPIGKVTISARRLGYADSRPVAIDLQPAGPTRLVVAMDIRPLVVTGQNAILSKSPEILVHSHGNSTILELPSGAPRSIENIIERLPQLELIRSGPQKILRIRGSQANGVVIMLDGRIQNSTLTSQGDVSAIPLDEVSKIEIVTGGDYKSGGLAGSVNFITRSWQENNRVNSSAERGSFGLESYSLGIAQLQKLVFNLKESFSKGDFQFRDPRDSLQTRQNNSSHDLSIFGGVSIALGASRLDLKGRYFRRNAGVPGPIFQLTPRADSRSREMEFYSILQNDLGRGYAINVIGGLGSRDMIFDSPQTPANFIAYRNRFKEENRDIKIQLENKGRIDLDTYILLRYESLGGEDLLRPASSFGDHTRLVDAQGAGITLPVPNPARLFNSASINFGIKREGGSGGVFWGPSAGVSTDIGSLRFTFSVYRSRRLPDLTDLFWKEDVFATPNPDLLPEKSYGYEIGISFHAERFGPYDFRLSRFESRFDDIIVWRRWAGDKYKPVNLSKSEIDGWEISSNFKPFGGPASIVWNADFNKPLNKEDSPVHHDKYLTFRPIGTQYGGVEFEYRNLTLKISGRHLGRRYITEENTKSLPPVDLVELNMKYDLMIKSLTFSTGFSILNIGNKEYEILDRQPEKPREYRFEIGISRSGGLI
jgi:vitamin B12 transporter